MRHTWALSAPGGPHVGRLNLAIWDAINSHHNHSIIASHEPYRGTYISSYCVMMALKQVIFKRVRMVGNQSFLLVVVWSSNSNSALSTYCKGTSIGFWNVNTGIWFGNDLIGRWYHRFANFKLTMVQTTHSPSDSQERYRIYCRRNTTFNSFGLGKSGSIFKNVTFKHSVVSNMWNSFHDNALIAMPTNLMGDNTLVQDTSLCLNQSWSRCRCMASLGYNKCVAQVFWRFSVLFIWNAVTMLILTAWVCWVCARRNLHTS